MTKDSVATKAQEMAARIKKLVEDEFREDDDAVVPFAPAMLIAAAQACATLDWLFMRQQEGRYSDPLEALTRETALGRAGWLEAFSTVYDVKAQELQRVRR